MAGQWDVGQDRGRWKHDGSLTKKSTSSGQRGKHVYGGRANMEWMCREAEARRLAARQRQGTTKISLTGRCGLD